MSCSNKTELILRLLPALVWSLIIAGCKKVVDVDLNISTPRIVIEGSITNANEIYTVKISKTVPYSNDNNFPPVTGAQVIVTDSNSGMKYLFDEKTPGSYTTNYFIGVPKHTYQLAVRAEEQSYTASSRMPPRVLLDSITFAANTDLNNRKDINAIASFQDPPGLGNYYHFVEYLNGRQIPDIFVFEDRLSDGRYIEQPLFNDSTYLHRGDTLLLKMYCIDKPTYDYFFTLMQATGNSNGFQSATPTNPISNISNGALGYFTARTSISETVLVY